MAVVLNVSAQYYRIVLTFVLKILVLMLADNSFEFLILFTCRNAAIALLIRDFTYASYIPCLSMMLLRYVKISTSSRASPSSVIGLVISELYFRTLLLPFCLLIYCIPLPVFFVLSYTCWIFPSLAEFPAVTAWSSTYFCFLALMLLFILMFDSVH